MNLCSHFDIVVDPSLRFSVQLPRKGNAQSVRKWDTKQMEPAMCQLAQIARGSVKEDRRLKVDSFLNWRRKMFAVKICSGG